jgi:hypothetical protein
MDKNSKSPPLNTILQGIGGAELPDLEVWEAEGSGSINDQSHPVWTFMWT